MSDQLSRRLPRVGQRKFDVLALLVDHERSSRVGLSFEEIGDRVGLNHRSSVYWHVKDLIGMGLVSAIPGRRRSIRPTERGRKLVQILREFDGEDQSEGQALGDAGAGEPAAHLD